MKNMKVSVKLIVSFMIVALLTVGIGVTGIFTLRSAAANTALLSDRTTIAIASARMNRNVQAQRAAFRGAAAYHLMDMVDKRDTNIADLTTLQADFEGYHNTVISLLTSDEGKRLLAAIDAAYTPFAQERDVFVTDIIDPAISDEVMIAQLDTVAANIAPLAAAITDLVNFMDEQAHLQATQAAETASLTTVILVAILVAATVIAIFLALYISGLISKPLLLLSSFMHRAGSEGDIALHEDDKKIIAESAAIKDEIGRCIKSAAEFVEYVSHVSELLHLVADGDLTHDFEPLSEKDVMGMSLHKMLGELNDMFSDIHKSANQVSTGSVQIADGAQLLAQGATEQSATVQELSASVTEVNGKTKANASLANDAKKLGEDIKANAERGNAQMEQMIKAVGEISDASTAIGKVIKIIDDIAFQTNILALNAAVEAARAGQHGKGFAVVADEVRSLAAKSAEAAKNTSELIATSIQKSEQGAAISKETAESLSQIVGGIVQSSELVANIAVSSNEQTVSIGQIGEAIDQVSQVIQQNSATAEQSAAASQEMSGQAAMLQELIAQFRLKEQNTNLIKPLAGNAVAATNTGMALGAKY
jgi:methyl-accepting chemotaxis protein